MYGNDHEPFYSNPEFLFSFNIFFGELILCFNLLKENIKEKHNYLLERNIKQKTNIHQ